MGKRSLKASALGIAKAKQAFRRRSWTQEYLASEVGLETRQSIWKFFTGRPIERHLFVDICFKLDLDWEEIAELPENEPSEEAIAELNSQSELEAWVQQVRSQLQAPIRATCGFLQASLDVAQPLTLDRVYTHVNILPDLANQRWLEVSDLQAGKTFNRFQLSQLNSSTPALDAVADRTKLAILGKPGAGKTTFLQYLALQCSEGNLQAHQIPVFLQLRSFAVEARKQNFSLYHYISQQWMSYGLEQAQVDTLLQQGRALVLLDGLDEVSQEDNNEISQQIQSFATTYYENSVIVTCRIAAQEYHFRGFRYVEMADFDQIQIEAFAKKWFVAMSRDCEAEGLAKATQFLEQLQRRENQPIRELVTTPILLHLTCLVFQERASFPTKRTKLYQTGLDILLVRWDSARGIQRDRVYRSLSLPHKLKILSQIAAVMFEQGKFFFEKQEVIQAIADYLRTLPETSADPDALYLDSEAVLRAIALQHGLLVERAREIYSFSHLTFHEYLTAKKIVADAVGKQPSLQQLATYVVDPQWQEVILLTAGLLPNAESLLKPLQQQIEALVLGDLKLEHFITSIDKKCQVILQRIPVHPYKPAAMRAFYLTLFSDRDLSLATALDLTLAENLSPELSLDLALARAFTLSQSLGESPTLKQLLNLCFALNLEQTFALEPGLDRAIQELKAEFPDLAQGKEVLLAWWQTNNRSWIEQFRQAMIQYRGIGHNWQLDLPQQERLQQYYRANQLLVDCLKSGCQVSSATQTSIEETLLSIDSQVDREGEEQDSAIAAQYGSDRKIPPTPLQKGGYDSPLNKGS